MSELTKQHWFSVFKGFAVAAVVAMTEPLTAYLSNNVTTFTAKGAIAAALGGFLTWLMSYLRSKKQMSVTTETITVTKEQPNVDTQNK